MIIMMVEVKVRSGIILIVIGFSDIEVVVSVFVGSCWLLVENFLSNVFCRIIDRLNVISKGGRMLLFSVWFSRNFCSIYFSVNISGMVISNVIKGDSFKSVMRMRIRYVFIMIRFLCVRLISCMMLNIRFSLVVKSV